MYFLTIYHSKSFANYQTQYMPPTKMCSVSILCVNLTFFNALQIEMFLKVGYDKM